MKKKKVIPEIEYNLYIQIIDDKEGQELIKKLILFLGDARQYKSYLNGWITPIEK